MRAVWFIGKFQLVLNCNNYENQTSKSRTSQTRKTLAVMPSEKTNCHENNIEINLTDDDNFIIRFYRFGSILLQC
jgi:hypothetical protein